MTNRFTAFIIALACHALTGCALFVSHYDATAYQHFTSLKAYHLQFLEAHTAAADAQFDEAEMAASCQAGDLRFREAREYAQGKGDATRVRAIGYLHDVFTDNCKLALKKSRALFGKVFVNELTPGLTKNYDLAIKGELARVGAPDSN